MTENEIWEKMLAVARAIPGFQEDGVSPKTELKAEKVHGLDSMGRVELAVGLEAAFGIQVGDQEFDELVVLGDLVALIKKKTHASK